MDTQNLTQHNLYAQAVKVLEESPDFFVNDMGEAFVSQRKAEELLGLGDGTLRKHISRHHKNANTSNGLDAKLLQSVTTYYAIESRSKTEKALKFLAQLAEAGAKAFIYRMAGYQIDAKPMQAPAPLELSRMDLIKLAMEAEQERLLLAAKVEEMQPTVAAYDRLTNAVDTMSITDAAKQLNMNPGTLIQWMTSNKWVYKPQSGKSWMAYQPRLDSGLMTHITHTTERDGQVRTFYRAHVTAKGLATISKQIEKARQTAMILGEAA